MQKNRALVERYRGKRNVLVAYSLGTGSTLVVLEWLASRGWLREMDAALMPGTQLALRAGACMYLMDRVASLRYPDKGEEIGQCQRYSP